MLLIAEVSHVIRLPWQQQQPLLQWLITPAIQVITGQLTCNSKTSLFIGNIQIH